MAVIAIRTGARSAATPKAVWLVVLAALALTAGLLSLFIGSVPINAGSIVWTLTHPSASGFSHTVVWDIRFPRLLIGVCVGAGLGVAGAMLQALFRNPLVDPYVTGVSAGAALAASASIALGLSFALVPAFAFAGGLACAALVALIGAGGSLRLVLSGIAVSTLCAAMVTIVLLRSGSSDSLTILGWLAGSISGKSWDDAGWTASYLAAGCTAALLLLPSLNVLRLGADAAAGLGVRVGRARFFVLASAALIAAACVAVSGIVGFVGLMVPHGARRLVGGDAAWLLPASAAGGSAVVIVADACARTVFAPAEMPLGVLLAFIGVPFFLILARRPVEL